MASLTVELISGPFERFEADLGIVFYFLHDRPLRGAAGRADWRLCGRLSDLLRNGRMLGGRGQGTLLTARAGVEAGRLMALGLGERESFDSQALEELSGEAVRRALGLGARTLLVPIPDENPAGLELEDLLGTWLAGAAKVLAERPAFDLHLRLMARPEDRQAALDWLVKHELSGLSSEVAFRIVSDASEDPAVRPSPAPERSGFDTPAN
ncbi:hypothetical protein MK489_16390 [Myxococcota bacterium]|nr:hypothetical protein [Myxococcota bacterium]